MMQNFLPFCDSLLQFDSLHLSSENNLVSFKVSGLSGNPVINAEAKTITLSFRENANQKNLKPTVVLSPGAAIEPSVYTAVDFSAGEVTYTVTSEDGTRTDHWKVVNSTSSVNEGTDKSGLLIYPNPSKGSFSIESADADLQSVTLINMLGDILQSNRLNGKRITLDTNQLVPGIYFVSIKTAQSECIRKIVLQ